jgi:pSer/pThr/pTyr-binding forkhead associated (FHA) protein/tetratricopeptide (TPR) repeat protein
MAKLKLYHQGQLLTELGLNPGEEYFAGRSSTCQFVLTHDRGISRQHVRIAFENDVWVVTLMSKFGGLIYAGQKVDQVRLDSDTRFTIPPYEFEFTIADVASQPVVSDQPLPVEERAREPGEVVRDDVIDTPNMSSGPKGLDGVPPAAEPVVASDGDTNGGNFEATKVASSTIVPFLRIMNRANGHEEILKLEGNAWIAGRHPDSEIYINDSSISRKHFEIVRAAGGFFIRDHNSSNGTTVNGESIPPGEQQRLISGDVITIRNIQVTFEVHDTGFDQRIKNLPALANQSDAYNDGDDSGEYEVSNALQVAGMGNGGNGPAVIRLEPGAGGNEANAKQKKMRLAIGATLLILILGYGFMDETPAAKDGQDQGEPGDSEMPSKKPVSAQRMKELDDKYKLASQNFQSGKYTLCRDMLIEVHNEVPSIGDSQSLLKYCEQAIDLEMVNRERNLKEQKKAEAENKIRSVVANCQSLYTDTITEQKMQDCLADALELDPQNAGGIELLERIKARDQQRMSEQAQKAAINAQASDGRAHYKRAADLESRGELRRALVEFNSFIRKQYPNVKTQEESARRSIANIQQNLNQKVAERLSSCRLFIEKSEFKSAMKACNDALKEDPNNGDAKELLAKAKNDMSRGLKSVYEDSVLEESMGNIEAAKEKWKTIMGNSYSGENFYEKAKSKMKKYGG